MRYTFYIIHCIIHGIVQCITFTVHYIKLHRFTFHYVTLCNGLTYCIIKPVLLLCNNNFCLSLSLNIIHYFTLNYFKLY